MHAITQSTPVIVFENADDAGDGHRTTWGAFCADNADGFSRADLTLIALDLATEGRHVANEGAGGCWRIALDTVRA